MSDFFAFRESVNTEPPAGAGGGRGGSNGLLDFEVHTTDGHVGKIQDVADGPGESYVIISTGGALLSKKVMLPAGMVERVDHDAKSVHVDCTTDQLKASPEFDEHRYQDAAYRDELAAHYHR